MKKDDKKADKKNSNAKGAKKEMEATPAESA